MEICYNHMFIYAEFEIINMFFKERRSKYKPAYALDTQHFLNCSCLSRDFSLVMDIWFQVMEKSWKSHGKVMEIHWSTCVRTLTSTSALKRPRCCGERSAVRVPTLPSRHTDAVNRFYYIFKAR